jgi:hypothetical protein
MLIWPPIWSIISFMKPNQLLLADIGHFESERYTKNYIVEYLRKKILNLQLFYQKKIQIQLSTYRIWRIQRIKCWDKLRAIYDLQLIDSRIDEIRNVRGELPLEVEDLEDEVAGLSTRSEKLKSELEVVEDLIKVKECNWWAQRGYQKIQKQQETVRNKNLIRWKRLNFKIRNSIVWKQIKEMKASIEHKKEVIANSKERLESQIT